MAHFAKLNANNEVESVVGIANDVAVTEQAGIDFLNNLFGTNDTWKQTSYNTNGGVHYQPNTNTPSEDQSLSFRKNYAGIGYTYDESRDAFILPQPYSSWTLNEDTCYWESPIPYPDDGKTYRWNEDTTHWDEIV